MKVYLDLIFILNFFFDFLILIGVSFLLKRKVILKRIFLSSFIGLFSLVFLFLNFSSLWYFLFKNIILILMVIVAFGFNDIKYTLQNIFYMYVISVVIGGSFYLLNFEVDNFLFKEYGIIINFLLLIILFPIILYLYIKQVKQLKNNYDNYYRLDIYLKDRKVENIIAFLDTGNKLIDPYLGRPIILVDKNKLGFKIDNPLLVPYDTVNNHGLLKCVVPDKLFIEGKRVKMKVLIGLSEQKIGIDGVDCILHEKILERMSL